MPLLQISLTSPYLSVIDAMPLWEGNPFPDNRGKDASPTDFPNLPSNSALSATVPPQDE